MKTLAQRLTCGLPLASASLCPAMLMTPQTMAESRILAVADFGSSPTNDTPDGCDDLLWHDFETGEVIIHYLNDDGVSVRNVIGSISDIELVSPGNGYFSSDSIVVDDEGTGGIGLAATLNVVGPIAAVTMLDAGRDYVNGEPLVVTNPRRGWWLRLQCNHPDRRWRRRCRAGGQGQGGRWWPRVYPGSALP